MKQVKAASPRSDKNNVKVKSPAKTRVYKIKTTLRAYALKRLDAVSSLATHATHATYARSGKWHCWNLLRDMACVNLERSIALARRVLSSHCVHCVRCMRCVRVETALNCRTDVGLAYDRVMHTARGYLLHSAHNSKSPCVSFTPPSFLHSVASQRSNCEEEESILSLLRSVEKKEMLR